jgi:hypothetical protein
MGELELPAEEYAGRAWVSTGSTTGEAGSTTGEVSTGSTTEGLEVAVDLRGHFEPLDGRFHWYGRISASEQLAARFGSGETVLLTTPHGNAEGRLSDVDPWGRFRISGTGRPPF